VKEAPAALKLLKIKPGRLLRSAVWASMMAQYTGTKVVLAVDDISAEYRYYRRSAEAERNLLNVSETVLGTIRDRNFPRRCRLIYFDGGRLSRSSIIPSR